MAKLPHEKLYVLQHKIDQQRSTVEALKREGHEHTDADRQLAQMVAEAEMLGHRAPTSPASDISPPEAKGRSPEA